MCNQVQSVTLQTAVLMQVKEFAQTNTPFSVHDITRTIRTKAAQGELEIPEVEVQGASFRFDIPHPKVKGIFEEMWKTGVFDPDFTLSRQFNGMYWLYTPAPVNGGASYAGVSVTPQPAVAPAVASATNANNVGQNWGANVSVTNSDRIKLYLSNCIAKNFRPTLRKVQSAIKRNDSIPIPSCEELKDYIENVLGYAIVDDPDGISRAQVATV